MHYAKNVATCFFKARLIIDVAQDQNFRQIDVTVHQASRDAMALELKSGPILNGLRVPTYTRSLDAVINFVEDVLLGWIWNVSRGNTSDRAWLQPDLAQHEHGRGFSEMWFDCVDPLGDGPGLEITRPRSPRGALALLEVLIEVADATESDHKPNPRLPAVAALLVRAGLDPIAPAA